MKYCVLCILIFYMECEINQIIISHDDMKACQLSRQLFFKHSPVKNNADFLIYLNC